MTPDTPSDPQKGKVDEPTPDEAKDAKATASQEKTEAKADATGKAKKSDGEAKKPAAKKPAAKKPAAKKKPAAAKSDKSEPSAKATEAAAEETGVDKAAAKAGAEAEDEPKKPGRKKAATKTEAEAKDAPKAPAAGSRRSTRRRDASEPVLVVRAHAKYVRTSARKARLVCDNIRGKDVAQARAILAFTPRSVSEAWSKLLESAVANAEHNHELVGEDLRVTRVFADEGPTLKRFRPRAMGRATRIRKRTSHLTIELTPKEQ